MDTIGRVMELLFSLMTQKTQNISEDILSIIKMLFLRLFIAAAALAFFCIGLSLILTKLAHQWEQEIVVGSVIASLSLIIFIAALISGFFKTKTLKKKSSGPSPLEQALALLVVDIVEERKSKRGADQR